MRIFPARFYHSHNSSVRSVFINLHSTMQQECKINCHHATYSVYKITLSRIYHIHYLSNKVKLKHNLPVVEDEFKKKRKITLHQNNNNNKKNGIQETKINMLKLIRNNHEPYFMPIGDATVGSRLGFWTDKRELREEFDYNTRYIILAIPFDSLFCQLLSRCLRAPYILDRVHCLLVWHNLDNEKGMCQ